MITNTVTLSPLIISLDDAAATPPVSFLVMRFGRNEFTKSEKTDSFDFTEVEADAIIDEFSTRKKDIVIDYEHQTLSGDRAPAAGWIKAIEKTADGLVASVEWTDKAKEYLKAREYRYHSPVLHVRDGRMYRLHSVALTNHPALHDYPALVANDTTPQTEEPMNEHLKKIAETLGVAVVALADGKPDEKSTADAIAAKCAETKTRAESVTAFLALHDAKNLDEMTLKIQGMVPAAEKTELLGRLAKIEAEKAVTKAFSDGKLIEVQRKWAVEYASRDLAAFADFIAAAPKVAPGPAPVVTAQSVAAPMAFSDAEVKIFKLSGLSDKQIEEMKAKKAATKEEK